MTRRIVAGVLLIGLGAALFGSQLPLSGTRAVLGVSCLLLWGGAGVAVLARRSSGRWIGLVLSVVGVAVAAWATAQANVGDAKVIADLFFTADGPNFSWMDVALGAVAFAILSAVTAVALIQRIDREVRNEPAAAPPDAA